MTVSKTAAKSVSLPVGSATALLAWANDAGNWSGSPMVNDTFGRSTGGYVAKLVAAGMVTTCEDGEETFVSFTEAGITAAEQLGADLSFLKAADPHGLNEAAPAKKASKHEGHEIRITKSGSYCYTCDRVAAEAQKAARAAAK